MNSSTKKLSIIDTPKTTIAVDKVKLENIKHRYGVQKWNIVLDSNFSFLPNYVNWKTKTITIRVYNLWSYVFVGKSVAKRNKQLPKLLAHEIRHTQQDPPDNSLMGILKSVRYLYWFHPQEKDARQWSGKHQKEFKDLITINLKH